MKIYYRIYLFATVTTEQGALIIGGYDGSDVATVACYNKAGWSRLEDLHYTRRNHRAIINGDKVYVVGGYGTVVVDAFRYTEIWSFEENSLSIKLADPQLDEYWSYPELLLVDPSYCVKP